MIVPLATAVVRAACAPAARRFRAALDEPAAAQRRVLAGIAADLARSEYGRSLGVAMEDGWDAFRTKVPVVGHADLAPWIARQKAGEPALTARPLTGWSLTSGSGGPRKEIPRTAALDRAFRALFAVWADDLLRHALRPRLGRLFISVSPPVGDQRATDDSERLGPLLRPLVRRFLTRPAAGPAETFRDRLAAALVAARDLEVISVWSPTYLLVLLDHIERHAARFGLPRAAIDWRKVWPRVQLVSCWASGPAAAPAARLATLFPGVPLQGKGLVATEAPVTVPLWGQPGAAPLVDSVLIEIDTGAGLLPLEALREGDEGGVVVSQPGGLVRYRLGDRVRVVERIGATPLLDFLGRADRVSDLTGEKLDAVFVQGVLRRLNCSGVLLPEPGVPARYVLVTDRPLDAAVLDAALAESHQYALSRRTGQLAPAAIRVHADWPARLQALLAADGLAWGDQKDEALIADPKLAARLLADLEQP